MGDGLSPWQEANALVRGGYADEPKLDAMIQLRLRLTPHIFPAEDRAAYAALLIRGHVESTSERPQAFVWHRLIGSTKLKVGVR